MDGHLGARPMRAEQEGPLLGLRVLDLTRVLSGPFCTMMLADLGADVIKVEPPEGDLTRFQGPFALEDTERAFGGYFASVNRNKRGIVLDLKDPADRERLLDLVDESDVLVENFRAGVMERLGLSYELLHERNPRLVYGAIRGFGDPRSGESPHNDWPSFDVVAQAMGGIVSVTGTEDGEVVRVGPSIGDLYPATVAAVAILAAAMHARATGDGQFVDVAMVDAIVALDEAMVYTYSYTGSVARPVGSSHPQSAPFGIFTTADGACAIAAPTEQYWANLCAAMDRSDLLDDERTSTMGRRLKHREFVRDQVLEWTKTLPTAAVTAALGGTVPVGPVNDAADLFSDPHVQARGMLVGVDHPGVERPMVFPDTPMRFSDTPAGIYRRPPRLGEHTAEVFAELDRRQ
jgi:crotonobetainyl-CoA:carnitine CoA-transferase CaiB-like acyl-CoA transferase